MNLATTAGVSAATQRIRDAFNLNRSKMTMMLARELGVSEVEVIRALPDGLSKELDATRWEELLRALEGAGSVHVIVSNGAVTLESFGEFGNFSTWGDFFNVQTKSLDMHIRYKELAAVFAVRKPGHMDGVDTLSVQLFDRTGTAAFKVFFTFGGKAHLRTCGSGSTGFAINSHGTELRQCLTKPKEIGARRETGSMFIDRECDWNPAYAALASGLVYLRLTGLVIRPLRIALVLTLIRTIRPLMTARTFWIFGRNFAR